jgi:cell fate (sporulation/competence/biofilm development) regulator YlbF (YheA/YmcA/DUF963 family)
MKGKKGNQVMNPKESIDPATVAAFVAAIKQSLAWKAFEHSSQRFDTDPDLQRLMDHYRELSEKAMKARRRGEQLSPYDMAEIQNVQASIQNNEAFVKRQAAYEKLVDLFRAVNESLSEHLGLDFARLAAPPGGGCCG